MPRKLTFDYGGDEFSLEMEKVDRSKLYGYIQKIVVDENDETCDLATLAGDGRTLIGSGGSTSAYFDPDGKWCDRDELKPVNIEGEEIQPVPSSFKTPVPLTEETTIDDYLSHNIRLVYAMRAESEIHSDLKKELIDGKIYKFPFSYRGGLEADAAFLLACNAGTVWMAVGNATKIEFISYEQAGAGAEPEEDITEGSDDLMDFGMM